MNDKKNARKFVDELLSLENNPSTSELLSTPEKLAIWIESNYSFDEEELKKALLESKQDLEEKIGLPLTEDQLVALSGGKKTVSDSTGAKVAIGVGAGFTGAIAGAVGAFIVIGIAVK